MTVNEFEDIGLEYATRLVNSGPVLLISACWKEERGIMSLAWNMPVQKDPPLIAIAMGKRHHTTSLVERSGEFVINIPGVDMLGKVKYCGSVSGYREDKFVGGGITSVKGEATGAPVLTNAIGVLECTVEKRIELEGTRIYLGRVLRCAARSGCFDETWSLRLGEPALIHHLGGPNFYKSSDYLL